MGSIKPFRGVVAAACSHMRLARLAGAGALILTVSATMVGSAAARKSFSGKVCNLVSSGLVAELAAHPCEPVTTRHSTVKGITETIYGARYGVAAAQAAHHHNYVALEIIHVTGPKAAIGLTGIRLAVAKHAGSRVNVGKGGAGFVHDEFTESPATATEPAGMSSRGEGTFVRGSYTCTISYYSESPEPVKSKGLAESDMALIMQTIAKGL
jgi:hypothetical protein